MDNPNSSIYNKEKVIVICDEYKFIFNKLLKMCKFERMRIQFFRKLMGNFQWTINRISTDVMKLFLERCSKDLHEYITEYNSNLNSALYRGLLNHTDTIQEFYNCNHKSMEKADKILVYCEASKRMEMYNWCRTKGCLDKVHAFISDKIVVDNENFYGIPVKILDVYSNKKDDYMICVVGNKTVKERIKKKLETYGFKNILFWKDGNDLKEIMEEVERKEHEDKVRIFPVISSVIEKNQVILDTVQTIIGNNGIINSLDNSCINNCYEKVIVYGYGVLGKVVVRELRDSRVKVVAVMDSTPEKVTGIPDEMPLLSPNDKLPEYDAIIVTAVAAFDVIKKNLTAKGYKNIINILELV